MKKLIFCFILSTVVLSGCVIKLGGSQPAAVAGIFKSFDKGNTWVEKNVFLYSGGVGSIAGLNIVNLTFDPQDNKAVYLATDADGIVYSYDNGDSWMKSNSFPNGRVESIAVDPANKCVIYSSFKNTILKTVDCSRTWSEIYVDTRGDKVITALAIDSYNNLTVYAGNNVGDILKSTDGGSNWRVINRLTDKITKILIYPNDTRIIYIATAGQGIFKSTNSGGDWLGVNDGLKQYSGAFEYKNLIFDLTTPDSLILVSKYGLLKTADSGLNWEPINLITPPASTDIFSIAINPQDNREIYYATASTFYKTVDGGQNWITKRLPTGAVATYMQVDPNDPNIIYMGLSNFNKK